MERGKPAGPGRVIVAVEDESDILEVITYNLRREGFVVEGATDGESGLAAVRRLQPSLVLLDLMLPKRDGLEICRALKSDDHTRRIPIIMVTAKGEESDIVLGLGLGADDYITKPFKIRELVARVRAVLRRTAQPATVSPDGVITRGALVIDPDRHRAAMKGSPIDLTATEFRLLQTLAAHPGRVYTRDQLLNRAVGEDAAVIDRNIDVHIRAVRRKLGDAAQLVETVRGVGYRFAEEYE